MNKLSSMAATAALPREDDRQMWDSEAALMDTIKAILEILMAAQIVSVDIIETMLIAQRAKYVPWRTPDAELAIDPLLTFLRDPRRREFRERLRSVLQESARPPVTGLCNTIGSRR